MSFFVKHHHLLAQYFVVKLFLCKAEVKLWTLYVKEWKNTLKPRVIDASRKYTLTNWHQPQMSSNRLVLMQTRFVQLADQTTTLYRNTLFRPQQVLFLTHKLRAF